MSDYSDLISGTSGLVKYYRMSGTANYVAPVGGGSPNGNFYHSDGSYWDGGETGAINGDSDTAYVFTSNSGYLHWFLAGVNNLSTLCNGATAITVEFWTKHSATIAGSCGVFYLMGGTGVAPVDQFRVAYTSANGFDFFARPDANGAAGVTLNQGSNRMVSGRWHHVAFIADFANDTMSIYHDGSRVANSTAAFTEGAYVYSLYNGGTQASWDRFGSFSLGGASLYIDEFALYNVALTGEQIGYRFGLGSQYRFEGQKRPRQVRGYYSVHHLRI
jgi:hypothetical protein